MKSNQIKQSTNENPVEELKLLPVGASEKLEVKADNYDGEFRVQSSANSSKRVISKRTGLQDFTCG